ncbi:MAG: hypothetical protein WCN87_00810 [Chlamydiota bacterium]
MSSTSPATIGSRTSSTDSLPDFQGWYFKPLMPNQEGSSSSPYLDRFSPLRKSASGLSPWGSVSRPGFMEPNPCSSAIKSATEAVDKPDQETNLSIDVMTIEESLLKIKTHVKHAAKIGYWLQVASVITALVGPILAAAVVWWAALPFMGLGVILYGLSAYCGSVEERLQKKMDPLSQEKESKRQELLLSSIMNALEYRKQQSLREGRSSIEQLDNGIDANGADLQFQFKESLEDFCSGIRDAVKPYQDSLSTNSYYQRVFARLSLDSNRPFLIDAVARGALTPIPTLVQLNKDLGEDNKYFETLLNGIQKKTESAHSHVMAAFWLRVVSIIMNVVGPILAVALTVPLITLPFMAIGFASYFIGWHFADRAESDHQDIRLAKETGGERFKRYQHNHQQQPELLEIQQQIIKEFAKRLVLNKPAEADYERASFVERMRKPERALPILAQLGIDLSPHNEKTIYGYITDKEAFNACYRKLFQGFRERRSARPASVTSI